MKLASAQIECKVGEIQQNLKRHYYMIEFASKKGANLIVFPEMSITGYCRKEGKTLAFSENDSRLDELRELSSKMSIIIVAGAPIQIENKLYIGSFILNPDKSIKIYIKQYLHYGEDLYYDSSMNYNPTIEIEEERISLAICADIDNPKHPKDAKINNCTFYIPSIFFSTDGITYGHQKLKKYATTFSFNILMSNYCGKHGGIESGGRSGFWNSEGKLLTELKTKNSGVIIVEKDNEVWKTELFEMKENRLQNCI